MISYLTYRYISLSFSTPFAYSNSVGSFFPNIWRRHSTISNAAKIPCNTTIHTKYVAMKASEIPGRRTSSTASSWCETLRGHSPRRFSLAYRCLRIFVLMPAVKLLPSRHNSRSCVVRNEVMGNAVNRFWFSCSTESRPLRKKDLEWTTVIWLRFSTRRLSDGSRIKVSS